MKLSIFSRKTPILLSAFHIVCVVLLAMSTSDLVLVSPESLLYYLVFTIAFMLYLCVSFRNPGYLDSSVLKLTSHKEIKGNDNGVKSSDGSMVIHEESGRVPDESIQIIETRFCMVCQIDQPIRAKHCRHCSKCVALHDHHCPWIGQCVGEKNRFYFFWYLVVEFVFLAWSLFELVFSFEYDQQISNWVLRNSLRLALCILIGFFSLMVGSLLCFHAYMALRNITTWELLSWHKIYYLKTWPYNLGSPFSKGYRHNLYIYCCEKLHNPFKKWVIPNLNAPIEL